MRWSTPLAAVAAAALAVGLAAPAQASHTRDTYRIVPSGAAADAVYPEGVATANRFFYTGSTTDGTIYRGRLSGAVARPFLPGGEDGRTSAIGMKADDGKLFVAGGATGMIWIYDLRSRDLVGSFMVPDQAGSPTFVNDLVVTKKGTVYATDSFRPALYRITADDYENRSPKTLQVWRDFTGSALTYQDGFNVNGIVATNNGKLLAVAQSSTGELYRIRVADKSVREIRLGGGEVSGDGLLLRGRKLFAIERQGDLGFVVKIRVRRDLTSGRVLSRTTYPSFDDPTTAAFARGRLLVVNSQFGERSAGETPDPFTVSSVPVP